MMDTKNAGALVPGTILKEVFMSDVRTVRILRSFWDGHKSLLKGEVHTLSVGLALQAKEARKAEIVPEGTTPEPSAPAAEPKVAAQSIRLSGQSSRWTGKEKEKEKEKP
jgi:hypothetical protein